MEKEILASDILKRNYFKSYSEFHLVLAMGKILHERGYSVNMNNMSVDADAIPKNVLSYYKKLLRTDVLTLDMYTKEDSNVTEDIDCDIDVSYFDSTKMFDEHEKTLDWTIEFARENYGDNARKFLSFNELGYTLLHLLAYHLVNVMFGKTDKKFVVHFDSLKAKTTFTYVNIYSCMQTMPWIRDYVDLDVDFQDYVVDLDYSIFCNNGLISGHYKKYTINEKLNIMKKFGMKEGAILVLWNREGMCENNIFGHINSATIIRLDEIGDNFLGVTRLPLNQTREEVRRDYYSIDEDIRYLFVDLLDKKPHLSATELDLTGLGVDNYFYDEENYLTLLDESEEVTKLVTIDDEEVEVYMSGVDAIYWLLRQYEVDFNDELFRDMYFGDNQPVWDKCHSDTQ